MRMPLRNIAFILGGLVFLPSVARAETLPSFRVEYCAWNATHIVEVSQGENCDAVFTVLDSWKGDLKKGEVLKFPEMRKFAPKQQREVYVFPHTQVPPKRVTHVSGLRMVLFLQKVDKGPGGTWPGISNGTIETAVAWIDGGEVFAYVQVRNPGGQVVWPLEMTEKQFKDRVLHICNTNEKLRQALQVADPEKRAHSLGDLVRSDLRECRYEAMEALGKCGPKGLPVILKVLNENPKIDVTCGLIHAMGKVGGPDAGKKLNTILKDEFAFWKKRGPQLKDNWWHDWSLGQKEVYLLRDCNGIFMAVIFALWDANYPECRPLVREVRDFLQAHPHLSTSLDTMQVCKLILGEK